MSILHHPDDDLLLAYAGGAADEASRLIVATHLAYCAHCRSRGRRAGGDRRALLEDLAPVPLAVMARWTRPWRGWTARKPLSGPRARVIAGRHARGLLRPYLGGDLQRGALAADGPAPVLCAACSAVAPSPRGCCAACRAPTPDRTATGLEYTLVLQGGFTDVTGS